MMNTEKVRSKRTTGLSINHDASMSSYRDSARQALMASKQLDGSLRIQTPFQDQQQRKVANLKERLSQFNNSMSQSAAVSSSAASITAATTTYLAGNSAAELRRHNKRIYRPDSNISNLIESRQYLPHGASKTFMTDLTRFSQNSNSKDLSPLRSSNLIGPSNVSQKNHNSQLRTQAEKALSMRKKGDTSHSAMQESRQVNMTWQDAQSSIQFVDGNNRTTTSQKLKSRNSTSRENKAPHYGSTSQNRFGRSSVHSVRTSQSSPERLVNIVCPPSHGQKDRKVGKRVRSVGRSQNSKLTRPRSDIRQPIQSSFIVTEGQNDIKKRLGRQYRALSSSYGYYTGSFQSNKNSKRDFLQSHKMMTPIKSHKSVTSKTSYSRSKSRSRLARCRSSQFVTTSTSKLSASKSLKKLQRRLMMSKWASKPDQDSQNYDSLKNLNKKRHTSKRRSASYNSLRESKSTKVIPSKKQSETLKSREGTDRDQQRVEKYLRNQKMSSSVKKNFNFASLEAQSSAKNNLEEPQIATDAKPNSGQVTGKFRSLNENTMQSVINNTRANAQIGKRDLANKPGFQGPQAMTGNGPERDRLLTEDDYCETLTASSEGSPYRVRASERVQRAARMTTKAYLEDVNRRVELAKHHGQESIREFGPRKMQAAYKGINERQCARLNTLKQQMQESLIETHTLQTRLQTSQGTENGISSSKYGKGVSQFNSLVLQFSNNIENMAQEMVEATESKRKNLKMKEMIAEMSELRRVRSLSKSAPASARNMSYDRRNSSSKKNSSRKAYTSRSQSARQSVSSASRSARKTSKSCKKSTRKATKSKRSSIRSKSQKRSSKKQKSRKSGRSTPGRSLYSIGEASKSGRSRTSEKSFRAKSRSAKKMKSIKRNIFKSTNGFRDFGVPKNQTSRTSNGPKRLHQKGQLSTQIDLNRSPMFRNSRVSRSRSKSISVPRRGSVASHSRSKSFTKIKDMAKKCTKLMTKKFDSQLSAAQRSQSKSLRRASSSKKRVSTARVKRKLSLGANSNKISQSRSRSKKRLVKKRKSVVSKSRSKTPTRRSITPTRRKVSCPKKSSLKKKTPRRKSKTPRRSKTPKRSKSIKKSKSKPKMKVDQKGNLNMREASPIFSSALVTPQATPQNNMMTPIHKILRNSMVENELMSEVRMGGSRHSRHGSTIAQNKKVKICSRRLQDIVPQLSSSDSDSSYDSDDSLDNERYLKRQQAMLSPWQRACIRKQLPKKLR